MNPNRSLSNFQGAVYQYTYNAKKASGVCLQNVTDYSPFGVALDGRTMQGDGYRYSFQGQEHDDEVKGEGNSVNYKYRMHDPRLGRFFAVDPLAAKYAHNSTYSFCENKVIHCIELEGLEAWEVKNRWTLQMIKNYKSQIITQTDEWIANKVELTCEDFVLRTLIDFARENNLPLTIKNGSGEYNQENYNSGDYESFYEDVLSTTAANDIQMNAKKLGEGKVGLLNAEQGNIILVYGVYGHYSHAQIVTHKDNTYNNVYIRQGNTVSKEWYEIKSSNPNSIFYVGKRIENGVYMLNKDIYKNYTYGSIMQNSMKVLSPAVFEWNFQQFNNKSIDGDGKGSIYGPVDSPIPTMKNRSNAGSKTKLA